MLKTAIYGLLRVSFDLLRQVWWWGVIALSVGLVTALFGVLFAAVQTDTSTCWLIVVENVGIVLAGGG
jgi:formate hydrogenlyase subunit 3/multisubunit Na+/H+ antiporter MnhD subunit